MTSSQPIVLSRSATNAVRGTCLKRAATALAPAIISGCISIPLPVTSGSLPDSRTNIPSTVPSSFAIGHTTRRDVLFELGEPDGVGPADGWYTYGSATSRGGVAVLTVSYGFSYDTRESVEYRRLLVQFDDNGVVSNVKLETKRCPLWDSQLIRFVSVPCLDFRGADIGQHAEPMPGDNVLTSTSPTTAAPTGWGSYFGSLQECNPSGRRLPRARHTAF
jgi:hypothetical protein